MSGAKLGASRVHDQLAHYFYTEMLCAGCGSCQSRTRTNTDEQNLHNFCAALLILCMTANSAHVVQFCVNYCTWRIVEF